MLDLTYSVINPWSILSAVLVADSEPNAWLPVDVEYNLFMRLYANLFE